MNRDRTSSGNARHLRYLAERLSGQTVRNRGTDPAHTGTWRSLAVVSFGLACVDTDPAAFDMVRSGQTAAAHFNHQLLNASNRNQIASPNGIPPELADKFGGYVVDILKNTRLGSDNTFLLGELVAHSIADNVCPGDNLVKAAYALNDRVAQHDTAVELSFDPSCLSVAEPVRAVDLPPLSQTWGFPILTGREVS